MRSSKKSDQRFMIVAAAESIAQSRSVASRLVMQEMRKKNIPKYLRAEYGVLHTQALEESVQFAKQMLERRK